MASNLDGRNFASTIGLKIFSAMWAFFLHSGVSRLRTVRVALSVISGLVFLLPIFFWVLLNRYYGRIPEEATLFGQNLRVVIFVVSGAGLIMLLLVNVVLGLSSKNKVD